MHQLPLHRLLPWLLAAACVLPGCGGGGAGDDDASAGPLEALPTSTALRDTGRALDVGIDGTGMLVLQRPSDGRRVYSRLGQLDMDADGMLVHSSGARVLALDSTSPSGVAPLQAPPRTIPADASTRAAFFIDYDARAIASPITAPFDPTDAGTYHFAWEQPLTAASGKTVTLRLFLIATHPPVPLSPIDTEWIVHASLDGRTVAASDTTRVSGRRDEMFGQVGADWDNTVLVIPASGDFPTGVMIMLGNGVAPDGPFSVVPITADGHPAGTLTAMYIDGDGKLRLHYDNQRSQLWGQLALAQFKPTDRLRRLDETTWFCGTGCQPPLIAAPGSSPMGRLQSRSLNTAF